MAVNSSGMNWIERAESAILELNDVVGVNIQAHDDEVDEVHIETSSKRPAKQIVRDVQTILRTRFRRGIDHRIVSVAYTTPRTLNALDAALDAAQASAPEPAQSKGDPAAGRRPSGLLSAARMNEHETPPARPIARTSADRVRFESVNLFVSGPRVQAQVELRWKGVSRMGSASGLGTRDGAHQLIAAATVAAVHEYVVEDVGLGGVEVEVLTIGRRQVMVVGVTLLAHRSEKLLVGSCTVEQDVQQAVVLATLGALNRILGGLRTRDPVEYVLRPTSVKEASGAKRE